MSALFLSCFLSPSFPLFPFVISSQHMYYMYFFKTYLNPRLYHIGYNVYQLNDKAQWDVCLLPPRWTFILACITRWNQIYDPHKSTTVKNPCRINDPWRAVGTIPAMRIIINPIPWRNNGHGSVSNHQPHDCLLNRLFRRRSNKSLNSASLAFVRGIQRGPANNAEKVPIWWRHHGITDVHNTPVTQYILVDIYFVLLPRSLWFASTSCQHSFTSVTIFSIIKFRLSLECVVPFAI